MQVHIVLLALKSTLSLLTRSTPLSVPPFSVRGSGGPLLLAPLDHSLAVGVDGSVGVRITTGGPGGRGGAFLEVGFNSSMGHHR